MAEGDVGRRMGLALYGDGLTELFAAVLFALLAVAWDVGAPATIAVAVVAVFGLRSLASVRERIVYPRTGYAVPASEDSSTLGSGMAITTIVVIGGGFFVAWYVGDLTLIRTWVAALAGALVAAGIWYLAGRSQLVRHRVLAMGTVLWGFVVTVTWGDLGYGSLVPFFVGLAAAFGVVGAWSLAVFLRRHPRQPS